MKNKEKKNKTNHKNRLSRRSFNKKIIRTSTIASSQLISGCKVFTPSQGNNTSSIDENEEYDFIIIGSGAGGGPLAANLTKKGHKVLVLEAGGKETNNNYKVPAFHPFSSVDPKFSWNFFVKHYSDKKLNALDNKYTPSKNGVLYPRAATIGGCTAHHAMIMLYPENKDWDHLAHVTSDQSYSAFNMRHYFTRLENCQYVSKPIIPNTDPADHGFKGWLPINRPDISLLLKDSQILKIVTAAASKIGTANTINSLFSKLDPNDINFAKYKSEGIFNTPLSIENGERRGSREYLLETQEKHPERLHIETHALATKVVLEKIAAGENPSAIGVEYLKGQSLYAADPRYFSLNTGKKKFAKLKSGGEVILAGGAFNTPQLLMLSGIGDYAELEKHSIRPKTKELKGVGKNLQDRYEIGYITEMKEDFNIIKDCTFGNKGDPCLKEWKDKKSGVYASNGSVVGIKRKSSYQASNQPPEQYIFGVPGHFEGYEPSYAEKIKKHKNRFTWAILKGQTENNKGTVTLRSSNPQETPEVNFRFFDDYNETNSKDLNSVVEGVQFARKIMQDSFLVNGLVKKEVVPPTEVLDDNEKLKEYIKNHAWGHHASCTCKMGVKEDPLAVVDSKFKVFGTENLRIVDASVFPKIPGLFIVTPIYMMSEKASDIIHSNHRKS